MEQALADSFRRRRHRCHDRRYRHRGRSRMLRRYVMLLRIIQVVEESRRMRKEAILTSPLHHLRLSQGLMHSTILRKMVVMVRELLVMRGELVLMRWEIVVMVQEMV